MITSILECPVHGKQGVVTMAEDGAGVKFIAKMTDGRNLEGFVGIAPSPSCAECHRGLEMYAFHA